MPRYDFRCNSCGATKTLVQSMSDPLPEEIVCGVRDCQDVARRVWEPPAAIHFKGPGFYSTDVKGRVERKRRKNPGDDLPRIEQEAAGNAIAQAI